jgi:hypothetical protein
MGFNGSFTLERFFPQGKRQGKTMIETDDRRTDWLDDDERALVARLRALRWSSAPVVARERCWMGIVERVGHLNGGNGRATAHRRAAASGE